MWNQLRDAILNFSYREDHDQQFILASGKKSPYYFDLKQTILHPKFALIALRLLKQKMEELEFLPQAVAGLTMGADPLAYGISFISSLEKNEKIYPIIIRKDAKGHGSRRRCEGRLDMISPESSIALLDDVITTGDSILQAFEVMSDLGYFMKTAFCIVDRKEGGSEKLKEMGVNLYPIFTLDDFKSN